MKSKEDTVRINKKKIKKYEKNEIEMYSEKKKNKKQKKMMKEERDFSQCGRGGTYKWCEL